MIHVTGGAGFIGANFVADWLATQGEAVRVLDKLTYAGNLQNLVAVSSRPDFSLERIDICEGHEVAKRLRSDRPRAVAHFAAESHVDRSPRRRPLTPSTQTPLWQWPIVRTGAAL